MTTFEKERLVEEKKDSLRVQARQLDYGTRIADDFSFHAKVFLKEQRESSLAKQEDSTKLLKRLSELQEAISKLSSDFNELSTLKLKEADSI